MKIVKTAINSLHRKLSPLLVAATFFLSASGHGATNPSIGNDELILQQQRERALQQRQESSPDVRLEGVKAQDAGHLPEDETPCFAIDRLILGGELAERFQWALGAASSGGDGPLGRCLGSEGISRVMKRIQNAIIERGYVTTRVLAQAQDLKSGTLSLTLIPGRSRERPRDRRN